ncbi:mating type pheromone [Fomitopsis schrenkii]|uniref:Mating type pheromone n=1 Tax=Fomitopsis schrenkii TaxID=2126942 RepID=S8FCL0_FOMSC|nr:mating type pheromone [Fomitopsis schrenkii]
MDDFLCDVAPSQCSAGSLLNFAVDPSPSDELYTDIPVDQEHGGSTGHFFCVIA